MINIFSRKNTLTVFVILIFVIALIIRLYYVLHNPEPLRNGMGGYSDTNLYHQIAFNLYKGNGFSGSDNGEAYGLPQDQEHIEYKPAIVRGPIYPSFIYMVYRFFSDPKDMESIETWHKNWNKVRIAQGVLDASVCILVYLIVRAIYPKSIWPAIISACLSCINLLNIYYTRALLSETVSTFVLTATILLFVIALKKQRIKYWIMTGAGFGVMTLTRPEYSLSIFMLSVFIILINRNSSNRALKKSLLFIIGAFIIISPWTIRNYMVFNRPILVAESSLGLTIFNGTLLDYPGYGDFPKGSFNNEAERKELNDLLRVYVKTVRTGGEEYIAIDKRFLNKAIERIRQNPWKILKTWISNFPHLWEQNDQDYNRNFPLTIIFLFYFVFAVYAFFSTEKEERIRMGPIVLIFIYLNLIFFPFRRETRYGIVLIPAIISLSGIGIWNMILLISSINKENKT